MSNPSSFRSLWNQLDVELTVITIPRGCPRDCFEKVYTDAISLYPCYEKTTEAAVYEISQRTLPNDRYGSLANVCGLRSHQDVGCRYYKRHTICSEQREYWVPDSPNREDGHQGYSQRQPHRIGPKFGDAALLRVCRSVSGEAMMVLHANTIFSFRLAHTLKGFVASLDTPKRLNVKSIHLHNTSLYARKMDDHTFTWNSDDVPRTMEMIPSLRNVHITIRHDRYVGFNTQIKLLWDGSLPLWKNDLSIFCDSAQRRVMVVIRDDDEYQRYWSF